MKNQSRIIPDGDGKGLSRRAFVKGVITAGTITLTGSLGVRTIARAQEGRVLNLLTWPGHGDPEFVGPFERQTGIKVRVKEYVGGEQMLAAVHSSPPGTFDGVLTDREYIPQLMAANKLEELKPVDFPFDDFFPEFRHIPNHWAGDKLYSVLIRLVYQGIAYNTTKLSKEEVQSYEVLWNKKLTKKVGWFDWYLTSMGAVALTLGQPDPFDLTNEQFATLKKRLFSLKPQTAGFYAFSDLFTQFANGSIYACAGVGDWLTQGLKSQGHPIETAIPKQGALGVFESISILKGAKNPDLVVKFIQYATSPEGQIRTALLPAYVNYIPNKKGWELLAKQYPDWATRLRMRIDQHPNIVDDYKEGKVKLRKTPVKQSIEQWNSTWTEFKSL